MSSAEFTRGKGCNNRKLTDEDRLEIVRLYTTPLPDGTWMGVTAIAKQFGVTHTAIQVRLRYAGVKMRSAKEAHSGGKRCKPITRVPVGDAPLCLCGCGERTEWLQPKNCWRRYVEGHQHPDASYKHEEWLRNEYVAKRRTVGEIAADFGVAPTTVGAFLIAFGIPRRSRSESRRGRKVGAKNAAWKGGVAKWDYASDWKALARRIRDRDRWTCQRCGERRTRWGHSLHVHHIDGNKLNNAPGNLTSLCAGCHSLTHAEQKGGGA